MTVDELLERGAQAVRDEATAATVDGVPAFVPQHRRAPKRAPVVAVIGVIVVVAVVGVLASRNSDGPTVSAPGTTMPRSDPHFLLVDPPAGLAVRRAVNGAGGSSERGAWVQIFVDFSSDGTRPERILTVNSGTGAAGGPDRWRSMMSAGAGFGDDPRDVTVQGHPGILNGGARAWQPDPSTVVLMTDYSGADLLEIANGVRPRAGRPGFTVAALPDGYVSVADYSAFSLEDHNSTVEYRTPGNDGPTLDLFVSVSGDIPAFSQITAPFARVVDVRGHRAVVWEHPGHDQHLVWDEAPGVQIRLDATGLETQQVIALANRMRALTRAEWKKLNARYQNANGTLRPIAGP